jgi:hypothetical protein
MSSRIVRTLGVAMMTCALARSAEGAADKPSLSRYSLHIDPFISPPGVVVVTVNQTLLEDRCKDNDGCEIILSGSASPIVPMVVLHGRFATGQFGWSVDGASYINADGTVSDALSVTVGSLDNPIGACSFSDADGSGGTDTTQAFSVKSDSVTANYVIYCTLTVID